MKIKTQCRVLCGITIICIFLTACGLGGAQDAAELVREKYESGELKLAADIMADFGDRVSTYSVTYERDEQGNGLITILRPAEIAGITATITEDGGGTLEYDGLILETGKLAGTALTPIDAIPSMLSAWSNGYMSEAGTERWEGVKCYRLTYSQTVDNAVVEQQAWFDVETLAPIRGETLVDGRLVITCEFS
ncbi:MAG: hypothetical protein FWG36_07160 [Oscillospiraceae bacterium]|nr:hypothetical protein [Oscillospiraceae bacterium]